MSVDPRGKRSDDDLAPQAWLVALLSLPHVGPAAIAAMLETDSTQHAPPLTAQEALPLTAQQAQPLTAQGTPPSAAQEALPSSAQRAWRRAVAGQLPQSIPPSRHDAIIHAARVTDVAALWARYQRSDIAVISPTDARWPSRLHEDPEPPPLLFARGHGADPDVTVAIVGTRACSTYGREVATELGRAAAAAGISVVSGLAMGIDAAAHRGAVAEAGAPPIAVLGAGFDRPTPEANRKLFAEVIARGVVYSETPLGAASGRWRFPARNRIIAALADAVVVVESDEKGGSLYTVDEALRRDRPVLAVPGSIRSRTSRGTNALLFDGATPCRGIDDVFESLGLSPGEVQTQRTTVLSDGARSLLDWGSQDRILLDELARRSGVAPGRWLRLLDELVRAELVIRDGPYVHRVRHIGDLRENHMAGM